MENVRIHSKGDDFEEATDSRFIHSGFWRSSHRAELRRTIVRVPASLEKDHSVASVLNATGSSSSMKSVQENTRRREAKTTWEGTKRFIVCSR